MLDDPLARATFSTMFSLLGLVVGSFVNVVASRLPEGRSVVSPPSRCPGCLTPIKPLQNVPVLSYLALRGRCAYCGIRIPLRYPVTEAACGLLYGLAFWRVGLLERRLWVLPLVLVSAAVYLAVAVIDLETYRIPRRLVYGGLLAAVPLLVVAALAEGRPGAIGVSAAAAAVFFAASFLVHSLEPRWLGFGDVRYGLFLGATMGYFGASRVLAGVMLALGAGSLVGLGMIALGKHSFGKALPFGPFLSLGAYLAILWGQQIAGWYTRLLTSLLGAA